MYKIITLPFNRTIQGFDDEPLKHFVLNKHVKSMKAEFFTDGGEKYWSVFIDYETVLERSSDKVEIRLDSTQKVLFEKLREWRKETADKQGVPVFVIGSNKELEDIVKLAPITLESLKLVKGFGSGKISKYGKDILNIVNSFYERPAKKEE